MIKDDEDNNVRIYDLTKLRSHHRDFVSKINEQTKAVLLVMNHGSTANAPNPESQEYKAELSVEKLVNDLKKQYPDLQFFATTVNYEPLDLNNYSSSKRIREAGVVSMDKCPKELAIAKLRMLASKGLTGDLLQKAMLKNHVGEMDFNLDNLRI